VTLLAPLALALSVLAVPIVLLYVLKLRRQEQVVASTLLWRRALDDVQANAPWQRLRPSILLILQLLAVAALVLVLAQPAYTRARTFAGDTIVIVDQSYGMQARDVAPSRFGAALSQAHSLASAASSGRVMSVIGMGAQPKLAVAESDDAGAITRAINSLHVGSSSPNFLAALSLASSLARSGAATRVVVLTSRQSGISGLPLTVPFPVQIVRIGGRLHDLGLTAFSVGHVGSHTEAVARVSNFGSRAARSDLDLFAGGRLADVRPLTIGPGQDQNVFWTSLPAGIHALQAHLTLSDDVATDKSAWAVVPESSPLHVLLVSNGDYFLQSALSADPSVHLTTVRPSAYHPSLAATSDLAVFDGVLPPTLPATSTLLVAPPRGRIGHVTFGRFQSVSSIEASASGPATSLLQNLDLSDVHVAQARSVASGGLLQPVVTSNGAILIAVGETGAARLGIVAFQLSESDWPLRISFPIAMQNLAHYLAPGLTLGARNLVVGQPLKLLPAAGTREVRIGLPRGRAILLRPPFAPFTGTSQPGLYSVHQLGGSSRSSASFAVNFFPARPAPAPGPPSVRLGAPGNQTAKPAPVLSSVAWIFWLLAMTILTTEWWFAFRR
jgi:Ca-activated chloride channel homolog